MVVKDMYVCFALLCFVTMGRFSFLSDGRWREKYKKGLWRGVEYRVVEFRCRADNCEGNVRV